MRSSRSNLSNSLHLLLPQPIAGPAAAALPIPASSVPTAAAKSRSQNRQRAAGPVAVVLLIPAGSALSVALKSRKQSLLTLAGPAHAAQRTRVNSVLNVVLKSPKAHRCTSAISVAGSRQTRTIRLSSALNAATYSTITTSNKNYRHCVRLTGAVPVARLIY